LIKVRCLGHIGTSVGMRDLEFQEESMDAAEIVERLRSLSPAADPGFTKYNTLVLVEDGEAFVPADARRTVRDGERVVLIPISHGG